MTRTVESFLESKRQFHRPGCMMLRGDVVCDCGADREREIMSDVAKSGGMILLEGDRMTFFAVKRLVRRGLIRYLGRESGGIMVRAVSA